MKRILIPLMVLVAVAACTKGHEETTQPDVPNPHTENRDHKVSLPDYDPAYIHEDNYKSTGTLPSKLNKDQRIEVEKHRSSKEQATTANRATLENSIYMIGTVKETLLYEVRIRGSKCGSYIMTEEAIDNSDFTRETVSLDFVDNEMKVSNKRIEIYGSDQKNIPLRIVEVGTFALPNIDVLRQNYDSLPKEIRNLPLKFSSDVYFEGGYFVGTSKRELIDGEVVNSKSRIEVPTDCKSEHALFDSYMPQPNDEIEICHYSSIENATSIDRFIFSEKTRYEAKDVWIGRIVSRDFEGSFKIGCANDGSLKNFLYTEAQYDESSNMELHLSRSD